jgi:hypothetical protein
LFDETARLPEDAGCLLILERILATFFQVGHLNDELKTGVLKNEEFI